MFCFKYRIETAALLKDLEYVLRLMMLFDDDSLGKLQPREFVNFMPSDFVNFYAVTRPQEPFLVTICDEFGISHVCDDNL